MSKVAEAEDHVRKAEKYLKTSFLKWSPDYDSAGTFKQVNSMWTQNLYKDVTLNFSGDEYSRAATSFKVRRDLSVTFPFSGETYWMF